MRRFALVPLAVLVAAACQDGPTGPTSSDDVVEAPADAPPITASPITLTSSPARSLGSTQTDQPHRYPNRPEPDVGGDLVVWRWRQSAYYGDSEIRQYDTRTGAHSTLATVGTYGGGQTSGRYTTWQEDLATMILLDNATGQRRRIENAHFSAGSVRFAGDRLAFLNQGAVEVYDVTTGARRVVTTFGTEDAPYRHIRDVGFDGRYVVWIAEGSRTQSGLGMVMFDLQTGQERVLVPFGQGMMTGPSVDRGRVAFSMDAGDRHPVFVLDVATGALRQLSDAPRSQKHPEIYGDLVVWEDTRQDTNPAYTSNFDVYVHDLKTGTATALAAGPEWTSAPQLDGNRLVYTQLRHDNRNWDVMLVELTPTTLQSLRDELARAVAAGAVRNTGVAQALENFLAQAAAAHDGGNRERTVAWLNHFGAQLRQHAGGHVDAAVAARLEGLAAGVIARL